MKTGAKTRVIILVPVPPALIGVRGRYGARTAGDRGAPTGDGLRCREGGLPRGRRRGYFAAVAMKSWTNSPGVRLSYTRWRVQGCLRFLQFTCQL